mmetsp:Transcript_49210/g.100481  ORF Transcript_49210/g.100481 Transcript_49210/m.100481 type:complete len:378 (-) Transcript_49210:88-1221(-)|eukprot:CAMPEP_0181322840 /NCGR_PEP_ID=MMETSP1101-20121128/19449_1 /TAXON_ID=46948 /ORGANISM="Rhodomonas abbreviata, Strain Caron Lab Isolate" /LENGTH=377 /DNA_ID=CAMNT_0023430793 /DNA_START=40 /DNA_END=1173 /DNA_ORIENTATION=-
MGVVGQCFRLVFFVILPIVTIAVAAFVGYLASTEYPWGTFFYVVGKYTMAGSKTTPPVPADVAVSPRPAQEMFVDLPSGHKMPMLGLGLCCRPSAYDHDSVRNSVLWFLLQGGRLLDGAQLYLNHDAVGEGIKDAIARGIPRKEIFMTTKIAPGKDFGYEGTKAWVAQMLKELQLDYVDLVLIHFPRNHMGLLSEATEFKGMGLGCDSARECRAATWKALSEAREQGLIKEIGVSNFRQVHMDAIQELNLAPIAVHQLQYHPWLPSWFAEITQYNMKHGIKMTGYFSLGGSLNKAKADTVATLTAIAEHHNRSKAQIMLRWSIQKGVSVIPGSGNPKHMKENLGTYEFELSSEEMAKIDALAADPIVDVPEFMIPKE